MYLLYYLTTCLLYLGSFIFCKRKKRIKNEKNLSKLFESGINKKRIF